MQYGQANSVYPSWCSLVFYDVSGIMFHPPRIFYGGRNATDNGGSKTDTRVWYAPSVGIFVAELSCKVVKDQPRNTLNIATRQDACRSYRLSSHNRSFCVVILFVPSLTKRSQENVTRVSRNTRYNPTEHHFLREEVSGNCEMNIYFTGKF